MLAVINGQLNDSVKWVRGTDSTYSLILLNDDNSLLDASAGSTTVTIKIYLEALKNGTPISIVASPVVAGADGEFTFDIADTEVSVIDLFVGFGRAIDVELDLAGAGDVIKQSNVIGLQVA